MVQLAKKYKISDVGLKKVCAKMGIPVPPRGYWAKLAAGKSVRKTNLPALPQDKRGLAYIGPRQEPFAAEFRRLHPEQLEMERASAGKKVVVPPRLTNPHPLIKARIAQAKNRRSRKPPWNEVPIGFHASVSRAAFDRAMRIADTLVKALEAEGHTVSITPEGKTRVTVFDEHVEVLIDEKVVSTPHEPTPGEIAKQKRDPWFAPPQKDYHCSGDLVIRLDAFADNLRKSWGDGKTQRLEDMLDSVIVGIVAIADALRARTLY